MALWVIVTGSESSIICLKECPRCSQLYGEHRFYHHLILDESGEHNSEFSAFGTTIRRITRNDPYGSQSNCKPCRSNRSAPGGMNISAIENMYPNCQIVKLINGEFVKSNLE